MTKKIDSLMGMRMILAIIVLLSHFPFGDKWALFFDNGDVAVYIFFILSGFGLTYSSFNKNQQCIGGEYSLKKAYSYAFGKMKKLYHWYLLWIVITLPAQFYNLFIWHNVLYALAGTILTVLVTPSMLQSGFGLAQASHLGVDTYWFLSDLFFLYMVYPIIESINLRIKLKNKKNIIFLIVGSFIILNLFHSVFTYIEKITLFNDLAYGAPYINVFFFLEGVLLGDLYFVQKEKKKEGSIVEIITITIFAVWLIERNSYLSLMDSYVKYIFDTGISVFIVYVFSYNKGIVSRLLSKPLLVKGGECAIYIYIAHGSLMWYAQYLADFLKINNQILGKTFIFAFVIIMTAGCSILMYRFDNSKCTQNQLSG